MKAKWPLYIIVLSSFALNFGTTQAASRISGMLFGDVGGLLHPNVNTSINTHPPCVAPDNDPTSNPNCYDPNGAYATHFICPTEQYYTPEGSAEYFGDPPLSSTIAQIGDVDAGECDETLEKCNMSGYMWSDRFGWTNLDGPTLQGDLGVVDFPEGHFARVEYGDADTSGFVYLNGFAWTEAGWVQLSACAGITDQLECDGIDMCTFDVANSTCNVDPNDFPGTQSATEWGGFIDLNQPEGPNGRPIEGFSWHENLGWIKWHNEGGDACTFGAWTDWNVDETPPEPTTAIGDDHFWWKVDNAAGNLRLGQFAYDPESDIDLAASSLDLQLNGATDFLNCTVQTPALIDSSTDFYADLYVPLIGNLGNSAFCMYTLTGTIVNGDGGIFYITDSPPGGVDPAHVRDPITFYVMPGDYDPSRSNLYQFNPGGTAYADGSDEIEIRVQPNDLAGNPLLPIMTDQQVVISGVTNSVVPEADDSLWRRDVQLTLNFFEGSDPTPYYFDTVDPTRPQLYIPVRLHEFAPSSTGAFYLAGDSVSYPVTTPPRMSHVDGAYPLAAVGYSPTTNCGSACLNEFTLHTVDLEINDASLPAFGLAPAISAVNDSHVLNETTPLMANALPFSFEFHPPINTTDASLNTESISIGQTFEYRFDLENLSSVNLDEIVIDHVFELINQGGAGLGIEVLSLFDINLVGSSETNTGRTDPFSGITRYALAVDSAVTDESVNPFHNNSTNHHSPIFDFYSDGSSAVNLNGDGVYSVDGPVYSEAIGNNVELDRGDLLSSGGTYLSAGNTIRHTIELLPIQTLGAPFENQVDFSVTQLMAYRLPDATLPDPSFTEFAVFEAANPLSSIEVQNLGVGTSVGSTISGSNIFKTLGQQIITLEKEASAGLQAQMRRNAAALSRNVTGCNAGGNVLPSLSITPSSCIVVNDIEQSVTAVYEGDSNDVLTLGGSGIINVPEDYTYTLVIKGGANLLAADNILSRNNASLGIILLKDDATDLGGNFYLSPEVTNVMGVFLYAEGSFLSSPDGSTVYYGEGEDPVELRNQLYYEGNLATRNTFGGGANGTLPDGISCNDGSELIACATRYDLTRIRNFAVPSSGYTGQGILFSGGGSCDDTLPDCSLPGTLPTTITLTGGSSGSINTGGSISTDPFYIQQSTRSAPPGFSSSGGFLSDPNVIR